MVPGDPANMALQPSIRDYKEDSPPEIFLNKFYELCDEYKGFC